MRYIKTPQFFFLVLAVLMVIVGLVKQGTQLDFNYFLTFLKIDVWSIAIISATFFVLISINYASLYLAEKKPKKYLTLIHMVLQFIALTPLLYYMLIATENPFSDSVMISNIILLLSFVIFVLATLIHLINFFVSLISSNNS